MKYIVWILFLCAGAPAYALTVSETPTIDFGSISYGSGVTSGRGAVTVSPTGTVTLSGSGGIAVQSGGAQGKAEFKSTSLTEALVNVRVSSTAAQTISTAGCGSITVSNIQLTGATNLLTLTILLGTAKTNVGATMSVSSITGYNCTISGTIPGALAYSTLLGDTNPNTPMDVKVTVFVAPPPLTLAHNAGAVLNFGTLCKSAQTQTLTVSSGGTATGTNLSCAAQGYSADQFTVSGYSGASFSVGSISSIQLTNTSDGTKLTVDQFIPSCTSNCLMTGATYTLGVGARLTVPASATTGTYTGTYSVSITY